MYAPKWQRGVHSSSTPQGQKGIKSGQNRAKVRFYLLALVFSRENRRPKGAKFKIYFNFEDCRGSVVALSLGRWRCPPVAGGQALGVVPCFRAVFPAFCLLSCICFPASALKYALFRILRGFLAGFGVRMCVCMGCVLCVDCVAFVRVWS